MVGIVRVTSAAIQRQPIWHGELALIQSTDPSELLLQFDWFSDGSIEGRSVQWVFIGSPSSKKYVYAEKLSSIANAVNEGKLVPEDIIFGLLSKRLEDGYHRGETGFILDGIPRTRIQAEILDQISNIDIVVNFRCTEDCLVKKRLGSRMCPQCHVSISVGNLGANLAKTSFAGTEDSQKEKFQISEKQNKPLEDYYRKQSKHIDFQVAGSFGETWQELLSVLHRFAFKMELYNISQREPEFHKLQKNDNRKETQ